MDGLLREFAAGHLRPWPSDPKTHPTRLEPLRYYRKLTDTFPLRRPHGEVIAKALAERLRS